MPKVKAGNLVVANILLGFITWCLLYLTWYLFWEVRNDPLFPVPSVPINLGLIGVAVAFSGAIQHCFTPRKEEDKAGNEHAVQRMVHLVLSSILPTYWFSATCTAILISVATLIVAFLDIKFEMPDTMASTCEKTAFHMQLYCDDEQVPDFASFRIGIFDLIKKKYEVRFICDCGIRDELAFEISNRKLFRCMIGNGIFCFETQLNIKRLDESAFGIKIMTRDSGGLPRDTVEGIIWSADGFGGDFSEQLGMPGDEFTGDLVAIWKGERHFGSKKWHYVNHRSNIGFDVAVNTEDRRIELHQRLEKVVSSFTEADSHALHELLRHYFAVISDDEASIARAQIMEFIQQKPESEWRNQALFAMHGLINLVNPWNIQMNTRAIQRLGSLVDGVSKESGWMSKDNALLYTRSLIPICDERTFGASNIVPIICALMRLMVISGDPVLADETLAAIRGQFAEFGVDNNRTKKAFVNCVAEENVYWEVGQRFTHEQSVHICEQVINILNDISKDTDRQTRLVIGDFLNVRLAEVEDEQNDKRPVWWTAPEVFDDALSRAVDMGWIAALSPVSSDKREN